MSKESDFLSINFSRNTARLQILWEWCQKLNETTGIEPPDEYFEWFDGHGIPKRYENELKEKEKE